jgi:hypothetical protein
MNDERFDDLLCAPLAPIDDAGFSSAVLARMEPSSFPLTWLEMAVLSASALLALFYLPAQALTDAAVLLSSQVANSAAAAMACLAIVLSVFLLRVLETD